MLVTFEVDHGVEFGNESRASVEVLNLLGEKYLELTPAGSGQLGEDDVIPVDRTQSAYDIVGVFGDLTTTTERIDTEQLQQALNVVVRHHRRRRPGHPGRASQGISRLSQTVASRDAGDPERCSRARARVSKLLADRSEDIVQLMDRSDLVFQELQQAQGRRSTGCWSTPGSWPTSCAALAEDNQAQIGPGAARGRRPARPADPKEKELKATLAAVGPYASILGNIIGTGPWFDAYVFNLAAIPTGEFQPGLLGTDG